jgi:hypothetical protein
MSLYSTGHLSAPFGSYAPYGSFASANPYSYASAVPFAAPGFYEPTAQQIPAPAPIAESEGQAPEGTPLSADLCARLGVPVGTVWGLPSGQRRPEYAGSTAATPSKGAMPGQPVSPIIAAKAGMQV